MSTLSNVIFAPDPPSERHRGRIFLIDFGLSKYYRDPTTLVHILEGTTRAERGTQDYASIHNHLHITSSRRDDMESLAYTMVKLLRGSHPWVHAELPSDCLRLKREWSGPSLCVDYPSVFGEFVDYTRALEFDEDPQYSSWKERFRALVPGMPSDSLYDVNVRRLSEGLTRSSPVRVWPTAYTRFAKWSCMASFS
ncbi:hypothetical protein EUX98_g9091 [Antrodiella citrinella]|uniref:Protein kinase domain-containing protein n=1 Tax=Antrodiella citrinella TaxID=2447956 RepID=A0A4S4LYP8_9APHY|nr:hypothetical protein EUX98_g9091 [Antrodiella citrinella]